MVPGPIQVASQEPALAAGGRWLASRWQARSAAGAGTPVPAGAAQLARGAGQDRHASAAIDTVSRMVGMGIFAGGRPPSGCEGCLAAGLPGGHGQSVPKNASRMPLLLYLLERRACCCGRHEQAAAAGRPNPKATTACTHLCRLLYEPGSAAGFAVLVIFGRMLVAPMHQSHHDVIVHDAYRNASHRFLCRPLPLHARECRHGWRPHRTAGSTQSRSSGLRAAGNGQYSLRPDVQTGLQYGHIP